MSFEEEAFALKSFELTLQPNRDARRKEKGEGKRNCMHLLLQLNTTPDIMQDSSSFIQSNKTGQGSVLVVTLSRPSALNALSRSMMQQLFRELRTAQQDPSIRVVVLTGSGRAFSAGADVKELVQLDTQSAFQEQWLAQWNREFASYRKPILAAVNGYALGGGWELAMMCDIVYCSENAEFGLPEITLGTIPGAGGTQRLLRAVGKSRAMELILTGDRMTSREALQRGLVSRVYPADKLLHSVVEVSDKIATMGASAVQIAKQALLTAENTLLQDGLALERSLYYTSFGTADFREGTRAFVEKRAPSFS